MGENAPASSSLENYRSLADPHLAGYFSSGRMKRHLHRAGLIRRNGELVSETTYRLNVSRKDEKNRDNQLLLRAIGDKKLELEREQHALVMRTMENISKMETVLRVKSSQKEHRLPSLARVRSAPEGRQFRVGAVDNCGSCHGQVGGSTPQRKSRQDVNAESDFNMAILDLLDYDDERHGVVPAAGHAAPIRLRQPKSPYAEKRIPRTLLLPPPQKNSRSKNGRLSPAKRKPSIRRGSKKPRVIKRSGGMLEYTKASTDQAKVTMHYYGTSVNLESERVDRRDDILVEQQHCGGNTLIVFRGKLLPGADFSFVSRRHSGFPFSTTIYVNGATDYRVSACCEYGHRLSTRLGSKGGHFAVVKVKGGAPCSRCLTKFAKKGGNSKSPWKDSGSDSEDSDDNMLYIPVESDDEDINVRPVDDGDSEYTSSSYESDRDSEDDASESESSDEESPSESENSSRLNGGLEIPAPSSSGKSQPSPSLSSSSESSDDVSDS